jgi:hypothetical protein
MSDSGIKKYTVLKKDLPPVNENNEYLVRYRIISEDRNRISHWSPIFTIESTATTSVSGQVLVNSGTVTAIWGDEENRPKYDVFVNFDSFGYVYHGTTPIHTYSLLSTGTSSVRVVVQIESIEKTRQAALTIFESSVVSL